MEFLLNNFLSSTEQTITKPLADSICSTFDQSKYQNQHEINHRWFNRINSLLASKNDSAISLGARLAKLSLQKNPNCLTSQGARWILACQNLIARNEPLDHICLSQIIQLVLNIFEWSSRWPDFARENCDPKAIINLARALIGISQKATQDNSVPSLGLQTLAILITRYASIIRPLASQLQTLALNNLLSQDNSISQSATSLLSQLYRLSGKTDASASWAKTIKATIGTIDILLDSLLSPFLKESDLIPPRDPPLAPLEIATQELVYSSDLTSTLQNTQLASYRIPLLLRRVERLINLLITMLSQPTERSVCVPLGELCTLVHRLLLLGKAQNHDRADQTWKLSWEALGSMVTLRAMGCRLIARVAECVTIRLTPFTTQILTILASEIEANSDPGSGHAAPDVSVMYGTYARIISRCPCNPDVVKTTLEPIIKLLLQDIQPIYGSAPPSDSLPADPTKETKKSRKKSGRYSCDPTWNATVVVDPLDLCIAERALDTLEILFGAIPYGFPTPYLTLTVRAVLSLATHPAFVTPGGKLTSGKTGILTTGSTERSPGLGYASRPSLRLKVMGCLLKCVPIQRLSSQELMGLNLAQSLTGVFQALLGAHDSAGGRLSDLARQGLATLALLARPRVPPVFPTSAHAHLELDVEPVAECDDSDSEHDAPPLPPRTEQAVPAAALRPTDPLPAAPSVASIARKSSVPTAQPWHSDLTSTPANKEEEDPASVSIRKRKSPDEPDALLRPSKKHLDLRPLTVEPDSSDDDNDLAPDGVVKLPQLTFDDDDDVADDDGAAPETDAERGSS